MRAILHFALWRLNWLSWWSCWLATGLWAPWCAIFAALGWRRCAWVADAIFAPVETDHCNRSAELWASHGRQS